MSTPRRTQSRNLNLFLVLMGIAAVTALLPPRSTAMLRLLASPLAFAEAPLASLVRRTQEAAKADPVDPEIQDRIALQAEEIEWFELQVGHLDLRLREQQAQIQDLTGLREKVGPTYKIIIGSVLGPSPNPREDGLLVSLFGLEGVQVGLWVASGAPPDPNGQPIESKLAGESLIGRVVAIDGKLATVQLVSDSQFLTQVQLAKSLDTARWEIQPSPGLALQGSGSGQMRIEAAKQDYFTEQARIVLVPASRLLPTPMSLGKLTASRKRDDSQLHFDLTVAPWVRATELRYVYIIAP